MEEQSRVSYLILIYYTSDLHAAETGQNSMLPTSDTKFCSCLYIGCNYRDTPTMSQLAMGSYILYFVTRDVVLKEEVWERRSHPLHP